MSVPLIGVSACMSQNEAGGVYHHVGHKYFDAVASASQAIPLAIPALPGALDLDVLVARLDGLFLSGSPSNVEPQNYGGPAFRADTKRDPNRDGVTLPLIRKAIEAGLPLFAVCRGQQELNVALGGTLHQHVHELPGKRDHRARKDLPVQDQYDVAHPIDVQPGGMLAGLNGATGQVMVNSLHAQAIDRLADGLFVEAVSDDGIIESVSLPGSKGFLLAVQWHPEHPTALKWPLSKAMFRAFGDAARQRAQSR